ncbi:MAG TPA: outer membrane lipoprotein-sorting protein [Candidatus Aminicenantes bacterium]|nr:outer membrane lipoprotein-sorting protein [Candidatus Aminicenantes bacterium]HDT13222.1 outer membrane lipoprotein-sorting protein [Candidatus Aminicenantes bacterium]
MTGHRLAAIPLLVITSLAPALRAQAPGKDRAGEIVKRVDELYRSRTSRALVEMEVVTPNWRRTLRMRIWSRGMEDTFIRILEPKKEEGFATLRIGNEMWNYLPKTGKVLKVPPSMMMSSWMGSDLTNDDLVKEFTFIESYRFEMTTPASPEPGLAYVKCVPKEGLPIVWGSVVLAIREDGLLPVWERFYDEKGRLARSIVFEDVRTFGDRTIPSTMELVPAAKEGHKTVLRYLEAEFDVQLPSDIFTLRNLRGGR